MKKMFLITFAIMFSINLFAQEDKYPSKEEDEYYKNYESVYSIKPLPLDKEFILGFKSEYYEIHEAESNYEIYSPDKYLTPYQDSIGKIQDSIHSKISSIFSAYQDSKELPDSVNKIINGLYESLFSHWQDCIGKVVKYTILKHEKKDNIEAIIYESSEYENFYFGESGIWIGYSENNGKDWNYYYTGIVRKQPVYIKHYSQRPLIKEKGKLEIEACLLRQLSYFSHPGPGPEYECVKDGIYLVFDMDVIAKDSDGDGLTDIVEDKLYLDKYNKDTNGDGIPDNLDTNPRVNYPRTEKSKIHEALLDMNDEIKWNKRGKCRLTFNKDAVYVTDSTETILVVTDNEDLMGIQPQKYRVIFMTPDEYKKNAKIYDTELNKMIIDPLFKIDNKKNTYEMSYDFNTWSKTYLIKKTKKGVIVTILSFMIS